MLDACRRSGAEVTVVGVDGLGRYDPTEVLDGVRPETALATVQLANHEVGTMQPAGEVVAACRERGVLAHVDACMAAGHVPVDFARLGADLCSISAHKFGGPKGAGALLVRRGLRLPPFVVGGAQERARRGGLEDVPAMVGFGAAAAELAADGRLAAEANAQRELTDRVAARRPRAGWRRDALRRSRRAGPTSRLPRRRGRRGGADPPRARPAGRGGALGLGVLERIARAFADPGGHGCRRRPFTARQRRLELDTRGRRRIPRSVPGRGGPPARVPRWLKRRGRRAAPRLQRPLGARPLHASPQAGSLGPALRLHPA